MVLICITSEMLVENRDVYIPRMHPTLPLGDRRRNMGITFGMGK